MSHLVEMETFLKVAARGGFSAAARDLGVSTPSVTRRISALESELGVKLISRTTRSLSLTESGRRYVEFAERILKEIHDEESMLTKRNHEPGGAMRVLVSKSFGSLHIGDAAADFMSLYPDVQFSIVVSESSLSSLDPVASGFDLAIRLGDPPNTRLIARRLGAARWFVCATPAYVANRGAPEEPARLAEHPCIGNMKYFPNGVWKFTSERFGRRSVSISHAAVTNSVMVGRQMALAHFGVALLPDYCIGEDVARGALRLLLPGYALPAQTIRAVYPRDPYQPLQVRRFIDFLADRFAAKDWFGVADGRTKAAR